MQQCSQTLDPNHPLSALCVVLRQGLLPSCPMSNPLVPFFFLLVLFEDPLAICSVCDGGHHVYLPSAFLLGMSPVVLRSDTGLWPLLTLGGGFTATCLVSPDLVVWHLILFYGIVIDSLMLFSLNTCLGGPMLWWMALALTLAHALSTACFYLYFIQYLGEILSWKHL